MDGGVWTLSSAFAAEADAGQCRGGRPPRDPRPAPHPTPAPGEPPAHPPGALAAARRGGCALVPVSVPCVPRGRAVGVAAGGGRVGGVGGPAAARAGLTVRLVGVVAGAVLVAPAVDAPLDGTVVEGPPAGTVVGVLAWPGTDV